MTTTSLSVGKLSPELIQRRQRHWDFVLNEAEPWHREHLSRLIKGWEEANDVHYGSVLLLRACTGTAGRFLLGETSAKFVFARPF